MTSASRKLIPTARRERGRLFKIERQPDRNFSMGNPPGSCIRTPPGSAPAFSSFGLGSLHRLQSPRCDQLAIRQELNVAGFQSIPEPLRRERVELSLTILAHLGERAAGVHVE